MVVLFFGLRGALRGTEGRRTEDGGQRTEGGGRTTEIELEGER